MFDDETAAHSFLALGHEARLAALRLLIPAGDAGLPSGEIAMRLEVPPTGMSFHLASLERAGLLKARRAGRKVFYAVDFHGLRALIAFLTEDCCGGRPEDCNDFLQGLAAYEKANVAGPQEAQRKPRGIGDRPAQPDREREE